jgi:DHA2 family multidrug resistance protein
VSGSIGISVATSLVTDRGQVRQAYLSEWASPFHQPYNTLVAQYEHALTAMGRTASVAHQTAVGEVYQVFRTQVAVLAYSDVFLFFSFLAFCAVPFCFLISARKAVSGIGAGHGS